MHVAKFSVSDDTPCERNTLIEVEEGEISSPTTMTATASAEREGRESEYSVFCINSFIRKNFFSCVQATVSICM